MPTWCVTCVDACDMPLALNACACALEAMPWVGRDAERRGYEIQCRGYRWEPHAGMEEGQECELIARGVAIVARVYGERPRYRMAGGTLRPRSEHWCKRLGLSVAPWSKDPRHVVPLPQRSSRHAGVLLRCPTL
jgi:hypothetical protein